MVSIGPSTGLGDHAGWKAGGTNAAAQKTLGLSGPFRGPLFASGMTPSPAALSKSVYNLNLLEPEFGFKLKADLPMSCTVECVRSGKIPLSTFPSVIASLHAAAFDLTTRVTRRVVLAARPGLRSRRSRWSSRPAAAAATSPTSPRAAPHSSAWRTAGSGATSSSARR